MTEMRQVPGVMFCLDRCRALRLCHMHAQRAICMNAHLHAVYLKQARQSWRAGIALAAHGPYTAAGVSKVLDLNVDVVGKAFGSFRGIVAELEEYFKSLQRQKAAKSGKKR